MSVLPGGTPSRLAFLNAAGRQESFVLPQCKLSGMDKEEGPRVQPDYWWHSSIEGVVLVPMFAKKFPNQMMVIMKFSDEPNNRLYVWCMRSVE
ncbi:hypothetical protein NDU88_005830 [Pleurodeles waltl]|uniref:Uncharacterized protein n=1 Tax=Pleurodeles waltl TaxID=8319 RepID=A0AAV7TCJ1_PLEWA|nr:hypothetical protein NDU88_005830 [Pleurodeles waltl]